MKIVITAIKDELNGFMQPMFESNKEVSIRNFKNAIINSDYYKTNANDYSLYVIGEYDTDNGEIKSHVEKLCNANSFLIADEVKTSS